MSLRIRRWVLARPPGQAAMSATAGVVVLSVLLTVGILYAAGSPEIALLEGLALGAFIPFCLSAPLLFVSARLVHELEAARLEAHRLAETDPLTGLMNRRQFSVALARDIGVVRRAEGAYSLLMIDVDDFKRVNDTHGHATGDAVLVAVANLCAAGLRSTDLIARWGGDELIIALPATDTAGARDVAERLRSGVATMLLAGRDRAAVRVTLSIGVASWGTGMESTDALLHRADTAMYAAKSGGRNRVALAQAEAAA